MHLSKSFKALIPVSAIFIFASLSAQNTYQSRPSDPDGRSREHQVDVSKMVVDVRFKPEQGLVIGNVTHDFTPLRKAVDSLELDAPGIKVISVTLNENSQVRFRSTATHLICYFSKALTWDKNYQLKIQYEATPRKGLYFIGWNSGNITDPVNQTRKQIWTQGQGIDNRHWIPMYDDMNDKFITETIVTFDAAYNVLSNGVLKKESTNKDGTKTWHYAMSKPHAGYLLMLAIDKYAVKRSKTASGVPVTFWYYPEHPERVHWTSLYTEKIIEFLESETGVKYPWESYGQVMVQDFMYGAMENTTATIFGDFFWVDSIAFNDRYYVGVNAHELTHQWFGDLITARSGADVWLQESWATYYAKLFEASVYGQDHLKWSQRQEQERALEASQKDHYPVRHTKGGTSRVYAKGSTVIQMLRYVLGDEEFKRVVKAYVSKYAWKNVETNDFFQVIQDELGMTLDWFFEQWLYRGSEPHYKVKFDELANATILHVEQIHPTDLSIGYFRMPVKCRAHYANGTFDELTAWVDGPYTRIEIPKTKGIQLSFVLFDVNAEITKRIDFEKSTEQLLAQFKQAEHMIDRYDALAAVKGHKHPDLIQALKDGLQKEKFHAIRSEIMKQLIAQGESAYVIEMLASEKDIQVLRSVLFHQNDASGNWRSTWEKALNAQSYTLRERALENLCKAYPENLTQYLDATKSVLGHNHNIRIKWLEISATYNKPNPYVEELIRLSSNLYEFRTRSSAFAALKNLNVYSEDFVLNLLDASVSSNGRLAGPAKDIIRHFNQTDLNKKTYLKALHQFTVTPEKSALIQQAGLPLK